MRGTRHEQSQPRFPQAASHHSSVMVWSNRLHQGLEQAQSLSRYLGLFPGSLRRQEKVASCDGRGGARLASHALCSCPLIKLQKPIRFQCLDWNLKHGARDESFALIGSSSALNQHVTYLVISKPNYWWTGGRG